MLFYKVGEICQNYLNKNPLQNHVQQSSTCAQIQLNETCTFFRTCADGHKILWRKSSNFFSHMIMGAQNICTHISEGRLNGKRSQGRRSRRWGDKLDWNGLATLPDNSKEQEKLERCGVSIRDLRPSVINTELDVNTNNLIRN